MNSPESQPDSGPDETYFDPDAMDASEQYFSASLEAAASKPEFVLNSEDEAQSLAQAIPSDQVGSGEKVVVERASRPSESERRLTSDDVAGPAVLSEVEESRPSELAVSSTFNDVGARASRPCELEADSPAQAGADWRDLVSAKVKHYKTLKPRQERYPSLQLQFDSGPSWKSDSAARAHVETINSFLAQPDPPPVLAPEPPVFLQPTTESTARVLEFPRPGMLPFNRDELAEPMIDRPRIVEAPELQPPPPALGGILIEPVQEAEPERQPGLDMPLTTATLGRKVFAAAIDGLVVAAALAIFEYMFVKFNSSLPQLRLSVSLAAGLAAVLWFAYQFAFLTYCGKTLGLLAARLRLSRFDGTQPTRNLRRWRVLASILSAVSLGLGYAWCFFDEDQLSWHDRITKTHLAPK